MPSKLWSKLTRKESKNFLALKESMARQLVVLAELESRGIKSINLIPKKVDRILVQEARLLATDIESMRERLIGTEFELELFVLESTSTSKATKAAKSNSGIKEISTRNTRGSKPVETAEEGLIPELEEINTPKTVESPEIFLDHSKFQALLSEAETKKLVTKILSVEKMQPTLDHSADTQIEIIKAQEPVVATPHVHTIFVSGALNELKVLNPLKILNYFAKVTPQAIAIVNEKRSITYEQLDILVGQFAMKFRKMGIQPGDFVVTRLPATLDWISTLALMSQGVITCSKLDRASIDPALGAKFLISDGTLIWQSNNTIILDDAWIADAENLDTKLLAVQNLDLDTPCRVIFTNGTIGKQKAVGLSLNLLNARVDQYNRTWLKGQSIMPLMDLSTSLGFFTFYSLFVKGEKIVTSSQFSFDSVRLAIAHDVEIFIASPIRAVQLLEVLMRTESKMPKLRKVVISGNIPTLNQLTKVADTLGVEVLNIYGSLECGDISFLPVNSKNRPSDWGWIYPEAKVQIINADGQKLENGVEGRIATSSPTMVHEYFRTLELNRKVFDEGWFYSGDTGYLTEDGRLVLMGRDVDLINIGKMNINPYAIEELVLDYAGVVDCAAFGFVTKANERRLAIAIVGDIDLNLKIITSAITRELGEMAPKTYFVTDTIPRDALGKIQRGKLEKSLKEKVANQRNGQGGVS